MASTFEDVTPHAGVEHSAFRVPPDNSRIEENSMARLRGTVQLILCYLAPFPLYKLCASRLPRYWYLRS